MEVDSTHSAEGSGAFGQERDGLALKRETSVGGVIGTGSSETSIVTARVWTITKLTQGVPNEWSRLVEDCTVWDRDQP